MQRKSYLRRLPPTEPRYTKFQVAMRYFPDDNFPDDNFSTAGSMTIPP